MLNNLFWNILGWGNFTCLLVHIKIMSHISIKLEKKCGIVSFPLYVAWIGFFSFGFRVENLVAWTTSTKAHEIFHLHIVMFVLNEVIKFGPHIHCRWSYTPIKILIYISLFVYVVNFYCIDHTIKNLYDAYLHLDFYMFNLFLSPIETKTYVCFIWILKLSYPLSFVWFLSFLYLII